MPKTFLYVVATVSCSEISLRRFGPEHVSFWHTTVQAEDEHDAYDKGYAAMPKPLPANSFFNDYVVEIS